MSNCKHCNKPIESHTGRRPKLYCNEVCRNAYFNAQKQKKSTKVWKSTYDAVVLENKALKARIKELEVMVNPVMQRGDYKNIISEINPENGDVRKMESEISKNLNLPPVNGSDSPDLEGDFEKHKIKFITPVSDEVAAEIYNHTHEDSKIHIFTPTKEDEIARLEGEIALLGKGSVASQRKNFLQKQIDKLKYS